MPVVFKCGSMPEGSYIVTFCASLSTVPCVIFQQAENVSETERAMVAVFWELTAKELWLRSTAKQSAFLSSLYAFLK